MDVLEEAAEDTAEEAAGAETEVLGAAEEEASLSEQAHSDRHNAAQRTTSKRLFFTQKSSFRQLNQPVDDKNTNVADDNAGSGGGCVYIRNHQANPQTNNGDYSRVQNNRLKAFAQPHRG